MDPSMNFGIPLNDLKICKDHKVICGGSKNDAGENVKGIIGVVDFENNAHVYNIKNDIILDLDIFDFSNSEDNHFFPIENKNVHSGILIGGFSEEYLYVLFYNNGNFTLLSKISVNVNSIYLTEHLIVLDNNGRLFAFYDVLNRNEYDFSINDTLEEDTDNLSFSIELKNQSFLFINEEGKEVSPTHCNGFFVEDKTINVIRNNKEEKFLFKGKPAPRKEIVGKVFSINKNLIYLGSLDNEISLYINLKSMISENISDMALRGNHLAASTYDGKVVLFSKGKLKYNKKIVEQEISAIEIWDKKLYFTTKVGEFLSVDPENLEIEEDENELVILIENDDKMKSEGNLENEYINVVGEKENTDLRGKYFVITIREETYYIGIGLLFVIIILILRELFIDRNHK